LQHFSLLYNFITLILWLLFFLASFILCILLLHCCDLVLYFLYFGCLGYPGSSPPSKKLSQSTSVLYHKRSPDFSSSGTLNTTGTGNLKTGAESMMGKGANSDTTARHIVGGAKFVSCFYFAVKIYSWHWAL